MIIGLRVSVKMRKRKLTKLERIVKGISQIGKYAGFSAIVMSLGCIPQKRFSVSGDGRYLAIPIDQNLEINLEKAERVLLYDIEKNIIVFSQENLGEAMWMNNNDHQIVFDQGNNGKKLVILSKERRIELPERGFADMSDDGRFLVYSQFQYKPDSHEISEINLITRDLITEDERRFELEGVFPVFSPDSNHLLFLEYKRMQNPDENYFDLSVMNLKTLKRRAIEKLSDAEILFFNPPGWINNQEFIFSREPNIPGEDIEIMLGNINGNLETITDNDINETDIIGDEYKRIFYNDSQGSHMIYNGKERTLGFFIFNSQIVNNTLFYVEMNEGSDDLFKTHLKSIPTNRVNDPNMAVDLSKRIRYHLLKSEFENNLEPNNPYFDYFNSLNKEMQEK